MKNKAKGLSASQIKSRIRQLKKELDATIGRREKYFGESKESWRESVIGDEYYGKTEGMREVSDMLNESLNTF